jgi:hypothetical protein
MGYVKTTSHQLHSQIVSERNKLQLYVSVFTLKTSHLLEKFQNAFLMPACFFSLIVLDIRCAGGRILEDNICHSFEWTNSILYFFGWLPPAYWHQRLLSSYCLADRLPVNVHLITASRDQILAGCEIVRLVPDSTRLRWALSLTILSSPICFHCGMTWVMTDWFASQFEWGWFSAFIFIVSLAERGYLPIVIDIFWYLFSAW